MRGVNEVSPGCVVVDGRPYFVEAEGPVGIVIGCSGVDLSDAPYSIVMPISISTCDRTCKITEVDLPGAEVIGPARGNDGRFDRERDQVGQARMAADDLWKCQDLVKLVLHLVDTEGSRVEQSIHFPELALCVIAFAPRNLEKLEALRVFLDIQGQLFALRVELVDDIDQQLPTWLENFSRGTLLDVAKALEKRYFVCLRQLAAALSKFEHRESFRLFVSENCEQRAKTPDATCEKNLIPLYGVMSIFEHVLAQG